MRDPSPARRRDPTARPESILRRPPWRDPASPSTSSSRLRHLLPLLTVGIAAGLAASTVLPLAATAQEDREVRGAGEPGPAATLEVRGGDAKSPELVPLVSRTLSEILEHADDRSPLRMRMLFEKTLFKVDVLTLDLRFGAATSERIRAVVAGEEGYTPALADSVARLAMASEEVVAATEFQRSLGTNQFLDGVRDNLRRAWGAGYMELDDYRSAVSSLPRWYDFLASRGIKKGDRLLYHLRSDTLHAVYLDAEGRQLADTELVGSDARHSVLGCYFAPDSDFREPLIRSLLEL